MVCSHHDPRRAVSRFYKKGLSKPSITWPHSVEKRFVWLIDGIGEGVDDLSYTIRFTPGKAQHLERGQHQACAGTFESGLMNPRVSKPFERARRIARNLPYEQRSVELPDPYAEAEKEFVAWKYFTRTCFLSKAVTWGFSAPGKKPG